MTTVDGSGGPREGDDRGAGIGSAGRRASPHVDIRPLQGIDECRAAVRLQESIWGEGFSEAVPASLLHVLPRIGSVALGAFDPGGELLGLVFGVTGIEDGRIVHWSDMLGVRRGARDLGVGRRLKWAQREAARAAGAERMYWTADPLEARNAWFNVEVLGATSREYHADFYGASDSPLHRGIGTDRLVMCWELGEDESGEGATDPMRRRAVEPPATDALHVRVPEDVQALKASDPDAATAARLRVRDALTAAFAQGAVLTGVVRGDGFAELLLSPDPTSESR